MSGYRAPFPQNSGTGPMHTNEQPLKATHKLRHCGRCDTDQKPEGGCQITAEKWVCAKCWRPSLHAATKRKKPSPQPQATAMA